MADQQMPSLAEWLAESRARPDPKEVTLYRAKLPKPVTSPVSRQSGIRSLRIVRYDEPGNPRPTGGFDLISEDADANSLSDTWHEDLDSAFAQAEYEFGLTRADWTSVRGVPEGR